MISKLSLRLISRIVTISKPINPYTHEFLPEKTYLNESEIYAKIDHASKAYKKWRKTDLEERIDKVSKLVQNILNDEENIRQQISNFTGKSFQNIGAQYLKLKNQSSQLVSNSRKILRTHTFQTNSLNKKFRNKVVMEPMGLTLIFPYFSEPIFDTMINLIPCLISGNGALLKVSDYNHFLGDYFEKKVSEIVGIEGLVSDLFFHPRKLNEVREFRAIKKVLYAGSQPHARKIFEVIVQKRFIDCNLFYGGQDCAYVDQTADLSHAAKQICQHSFYNNGQSYDCIRRLYVHQSIQGQFYELLAQEACKLSLGDPKDNKTSLGPLTIPQVSIQFNDLINDSINYDASCLTGGLITTDGKTKGLFCQPTILLNCHSNLQIVQQQLHAPVLCSQVVGSDDQFINTSSDNVYGTGVRIFTKEPQKYENHLKKLEVGYISFNSGSITNCDLPIQGWKKSGKGKMLSQLCYEEFVVPKSYIFETK